MVQIQAQSVCTAMAPAIYGATTAVAVFAVDRHCSGDSTTTCDTMCGGITEVQYGQLMCMSALHIYTNGFQSNGAMSQADNSAAAVGLKTLYYGTGACGYSGCGPNFCCCVPSTTTASG